MEQFGEYPRLNKEEITSMEKRNYENDFAKLPRIKLRLISCPYKCNGYFTAEELISHVPECRPLSPEPISHLPGCRPPSPEPISHLPECRPPSPESLSHLPECRPPSPEPVPHCPYVHAQQRRTTVRKGIVIIYWILIAWGLAVIANSVFFDDDEKTVASNENSIVCDHLFGGCSSVRISLIEHKTISSGRVRVTRSLSYLDWQRRRKSALIADDKLFLCDKLGCRGEKMDEEGPDESGNNIWWNGERINGKRTNRLSYLNWEGERRNLFVTNANVLIVNHLDWDGEKTQSGLSSKDD